MAEPVPLDRPSLDKTVELMQQASAASNNLILVGKRQEGNPVLKHIRNVRWQYADIVPDYVLGNGTAALFISLRYHLLHPEYIHFRIRELQRSFRLRLIICHVDVDDPVTPLGEINRVAALSQFSLLCAWSSQEVARYLEGFKMFEAKSAETIQGRTDKDYVSRLVGALTAVRGVNKLDVHTLGCHFGSLAQIISASPDALSACPGIGPTKIRRLGDAFGGSVRRRAAGLQDPDGAGRGLSSDAGGAASGLAAAGSQRSAGAGSGPSSAAAAAGAGGASASSLATKRKRAPVGEPGDGGVGAELDRGRAHGGTAGEDDVIDLVDEDCFGEGRLEGSGAEDAVGEDEGEEYEGDFADEDYVDYGGLDTDYSDPDAGASSGADAGDHSASGAAGAAAAGSAGSARPLQAPFQPRWQRDPDGGLVAFVEVDDDERLDDLD